MVIRLFKIFSVLINDINSWKVCFHCTKNKVFSWEFPSLVNTNNSSVSCVFVHIYLRKFLMKNFVFCAVQGCGYLKVRSSFSVPIPRNIPAGNYMFKVNNTNTRARCEICSNLTKNTLEQRQWRRSGVFIVKFEHISYLVLVFLLLTLNR